VGSRVGWVKHIAPWLLLLPLGWLLALGGPWPLLPLGLLRAYGATNQSQSYNDA